MSDDAAAACRLCSGSLQLKYSLTVLNKINCSYLQCDRCGSLQTETPYWLDEAYASHLTLLDTGAVQRNLDNMTTVLLLAKRMGARDVLDFGGGDGMLCRLLRDHGLNAYVTDAFAKPTYAPAFTQADFASADIVTAFEVLEHFANPDADIEALFRGAPRAVLVSTQIYKHQSADWWYVSPETGQHVFFYSWEAMEYIARRYGYQVHRLGSYCLFTDRTTSARLNVSRLRWLLGRRVFRWVRAYVFAQQTPGVLADFQALKRQGDSAGP